MITSPATPASRPAQTARRRTVAALLSVVLLAAACSGGSSDDAARSSSTTAPAAAPSTSVVPELIADGPAGSWVGRLEGSEAFVAVVAGQGQVVAYVCEDGVVGSWFFGAFEDEAHVVLGNAAGQHLEVDLSEVGDEVAGAFGDDEQERTFTLARTDDEVLHRADALLDGEPVVGGWIRLGDEVQGTVLSGSQLIAAPTLTSTTTVQLANTTLQLAPAPMTPDTLGTPTANTTRFVWAAAGDSFGSGEGNPERAKNDANAHEDFAGLRWGDDASMYIPVSGATLTEDVTTCHRSDRAGAPKANASLRSLYPGVSFALGFVACSGAQTKDLRNAGYTGPTTTSASLLGGDRITQPAQLDRIKTFRDTQGRLDALYMSVGGNDLGFGPIIADCISPVGPANCADAWDDELTTRATALDGAYDTLDARIETLFGASLPVLISMYPNPVQDGDRDDPLGSPVCFGPDYDAHAEVGTGALDDILQDNITEEEAIFAVGISTRINAPIQRAVQRLGWKGVTGHVQTTLGHGVCTAEPYANLNSAAVHRQGRDIPDSLLFVFSSGFMHPNDAGFARYGEAITATMRPVVDGVVRAGLAAPANVRIAAADAASLTVRWSDRATSENAFEVEVSPNRAEDASDLLIPAGVVRHADGGYLQTVTGIGTQQLVVPMRSTGQVKVRVRACHTAVATASPGRCGPFSTQIIGTNALVTAPTGITVRTVTTLVNGSLRQSSVVAWAPQVDAIEFVVRVESTIAGVAPTELRTRSTSLTIGGLATTQKVTVAACNRRGCSPYQRPT